MAILDLPSSILEFLCDSVAKEYVMQEAAILMAVVVGYFVVMRVILPKLGVQT
jgi:hypothetical protein